MEYNKLNSTFDFGIGLGAAPSVCVELQQPAVDPAKLGSLTNTCSVPLTGSAFDLSPFAWPSGMPQQDVTLFGGVQCGALRTGAVRVSVFGTDEVGAE